MGTTATIAVFLEEENRYLWNTVNWDGYISHIGVLLYKCFNTITDIKELLVGREIRAMGFDGIERYEGDCLGARRGVYCLNEYNILSNSYVYLYKNGEWFVKYYETTEFVRLAPLADKEIIDSIN